ncbi:AlkA N-terminal domain-containing protein [Paenarthrobacter aurescens]|uniref:DNA-3-methyladenine glycosylase II n=1 Tax=Paenarthrobacter aurescens TaxID=43663 RepID=A0A4Y3NEJ8_PAEAU|nr:AlkA N-terminal domain-containing protein [Paenarthrobacter aurescens]MDO6143164.1 helix-turn-helix domain-containing protein [Paenarthrobacter aurescens]MDO6147010.1 helix-turn-helix domain-containing protein [Paenarthrobacter aurescens]MDO6158256.1 helix-turn-helix domain-containing protein [Paenarthrobacter aurescens]MDO6162240.1 helix-turn-helix domain-containing protein [Paenarthrobacter aurescens]GEB19673.1 putative 3-methyladenine DNA glycosylase AlkA [Paenarthrobacter aurescens]
MDFWQRYRAIDARDTRFDGQFFTAVSSTGIYCRPSCPARTPKAENVTFYETSAAAHEAGYRACKRCLPEAVPGTPAWNLRSDVAGRAMRLINDGVITREGVDGLAHRLGYSPRQLNRILSNELGAGPLSLARASRAQTARTLLVSTDMLLADVAFASGFNSVRQFNDTIGEVFAMTPTAVRATGAKSGQRRSTAAPGSLTLNLPYREPFDSGIFDFLAVRAVAGIEAANTSTDAPGTNSSRTYARTLRLPRGNASFTVSYNPSVAGKPLQLTTTAVDLHDLPALMSRVRRLFDLDADPLAIDDALAKDPRLTSSVAGIPGIRVPGAVDPHELLIRAMIGQQITVAAARTALTQLSAAGSFVEGAAPGLDRLFPTAAELAEHGRDLLRGPQRRIDSIVAAAEAMAAGELDFGYGDSLESLGRKLLPLPGVGPWTVGYVAMRVLGAPDVFLANDAAVRNGLKSLPSVTELSTDFREVSPWRSYATMHLWRAAAVKARGTPRS